MVRKVAKRLLFLFSGLVILFLLAAGYTQTQFFRDQLRSFALSILDSTLDAEIYIGPIGGNLITGISIDSLAITVDSVSLLTLARVEAEYDLFAAPRKLIRVHRVSLTRPDIRFQTGADGQWNFLRMIRPSPEDTTASGPFEWTIILDRLELIDGQFSLVDSLELVNPLHTPPDPGFIEYHDLHIGSIQLEIAADISPWEKRVVFRKVAGKLPTPAFELRQLLGEIIVTNEHALVNNLTILTTGSSVTLDASLKEFDLLGGIDLFALESNPVEVTLANSDVSLNELAMFIRDIDFLNGTVSTHLEAAGTFGDLRIRKLHLSARQTEFHVTGSVFNLHDPGNLYLDLAFAKSILHSDDARWILPAFDLPDLGELGLSRFDLSFTGQPLDFETTVALANKGGAVDLQAHLVIGGPNTLTYDGTSVFRRITLAPLVQGGDSATSLNGRARITGAGVDFEHLAGKVHLSADSSSLRGIPLHPSRFDLIVDGDQVEGTVDLALGSLTAMLTTRFDGLLNSHPAFDISGSVSSLDVAELLHDDLHRSDLSMTMHATGEGISPRTISGQFRLGLTDSRYRDYLIDSAGVVLTIDQRNPLDKLIRVESELADVDITGAFDLPFLVDLVVFEQANLRTAINHKFAILDSSLSEAHSRADLDSLAFSLSRRNQPLDMSFEVSIKDLEPLSILAGDMNFDGVGTLRGKAVGDFAELAVSANLSADEMFYGTSESGFYIQGGVVDLQLERLMPLDDPFTELDVRFFTEADDLNIGADKFDSLAVTLVYRNGFAAYDATGLYGTGLGFVLDGLAMLPEDGIVFEPGDLHVNLNGRDWSLQQGASLEFRRDGADFRNITMVSDTQEVTLTGTVAADGSLGGTLSVNRIGLEALEGFIGGDRGPSPTELIGGSATVSIEASGTIPDPRLVASVQARDVAFRGLPFGELIGRLDYEKGRTVVDLTVADDLGDAAAKPKLTVTGSIPLRLPFADADDRYGEGFDLLVKSEGIQIDFLDPLVPTFDQLSGFLRCDLSIAGEGDNLRYDGSFALVDCSFLFVPNNIRYRFAGDFRPSGDRITVVHAEAENIPSDNRPGRFGNVRFSGDFGLRDFVPTDFNLVAHGELLVVKPESRNSDLPVYGDLYVETGPRGLHFTGQIEHSLLKGDVLVQRSRLVFPPARSGSRGVTEFSVPVIVVDDTSAAPVVDDESFRERYFRAVTSDVKATDGQGRPRKSFLDGVEYDLNVETTGPSSEIKLIFSEIPVEDMQATFQGRWSITGDGTRWIGNFEIDRAQYTFFKQFDATGRLRYTGEFMNPELDIVAKYQSTRTVQNLADSSTKTERVVVSLEISGTRNEPKQKMSMTIDDIDYYSYNGPKSSDLQSDAIAFILAGNFPLTRSESSTIATDIQTSVGASMIVGASSLLTKELSEYLRRETGFITSVELGYEGQGSFSQSADIRLSGTAFKGYWRYRGTILDNPFSNANVSLLYSFGDIFTNPSLRNFMFELERRTETGTTGLVSDTKEINSARLFYRFSF